MVEEFKKEQDSMTNCLKTYPDVTAKDFEEFYASGFQKDISKHNMKCVIFCMGKDMGETDEQGVVILEKSLARLSDDFNMDIMRKIVLDCSKLRGTDACDTAFIQAKCTGQRVLAEQDKVIVHKP